MLRRFVIESCTSWGGSSSFSVTDETLLNAPPGSPIWYRSHQWMHGPLYLGSDWCHVQDTQKNSVWH